LSKNAQIPQLAGRKREEFRFGILFAPKKGKSPRARILYGGTYFWEDFWKETSSGD